MKDSSSTLATKPSRATRRDTSGNSTRLPGQHSLRLLRAGPIWFSRGLGRLILTPIKSASALTPTSRTSFAPRLRIQKGGGDLTSQMERWRNYLKRFKNTGELVKQ